MNSDIARMIELQRYWDTVLRCREDIEKSANSISFWKKRLRENQDSVLALQEAIKLAKSSLRQKEVDLASVEEKIAKLETRRNAVKNEREDAAVASELAAASAERGGLEEEILLLMDDLEAKNASLAEAEKETAGALEQSGADIAMLEERMERFRVQMDENRARFDEGLTSLSAAVRPKFQKLTGTGNGKAIVRIDGETCEGCRVRVPVHLAGDASKADRVMSCSNCGRFIYNG